MSINQYIKRGMRFLISGIPQVNVTPQVVSIAPSILLKGRTALVTGGTSGIGKAIAKAFVNAGADVIITSRHLEKASLCAKEIVKEIGSGCVYGIDMNNADVETFQYKVNEAEQLSPNGQIDILVNNAGINGGNFLSCSEEEYSAIMDTNLKGSFFLTRIVTASMIEKGIHGNVLNIASSSSLRPATSAYTLSKWGIRGLTIGMAKKLIKNGIVVNGLAPGPTATPMLVKNNCSNLSLPNNPSGRYVMPDEIANMAVVLTSGLGRMIVGDIVYMTGGAGTITVDDINY